MRAMDSMDRAKVREILTLFGRLALEGELLDVGAGSGVACGAGALCVGSPLQTSFMSMAHKKQHISWAKRLKPYGPMDSYSCTTSFLNTAGLKRLFLI